MNNAVVAGSGPPMPHRWLLRSLIGVATVLGVVAIFAVWANRQLLDTSYWTSTNTKLLESPPIREAVAVYLTDQLYANVDVAGELKTELPSELKPLAAPAAGALRNVVEKAINLLLERPEVQVLWRKANDVTHAQFVRLIENHNSVVKLPGGGAVVLDLRPMLSEAATQVGAPVSLVDKIPPNVAQLRVFTSNDLKTMQDAVKLLRSLALILPLLTFALLATAVYLARGRRSHELIVVGAAFIAAGLFVLVARSIIGEKVVDSLAGTEAVRPAASAAWSIGTSVLSDIAWSTVILGIPFVLAGLLAGPYRYAVTVRSMLAPYLREHADIVFAAVGFLLLLLFAWGPIVATKSLIGIPIITVLAFFGAEMLRRQTVREFPAIQPMPAMDPLPVTEPLSTTQPLSTTTQQSPVTQPPPKEPPDTT